jgi:hypothetical protein
MAQNEMDKEASRNERDDVRELENAFKLNIGNSIDKMLAIVTGDYRCPMLPGEPDKITKSIRDNDAFRTASRMKGGNRRVSGGGDDYDDGGDDYRHQVVRNHEGYSDNTQRFVPSNDFSGRQTPPPSPSPVLSKYSGVLGELERFRFSSDDARREKQMAFVVSALRSALQTLTIKDVAANTRKQFGEYVAEVEPIPGGVKVLYNFKGTKVSVAARGAFNGDETICVFRKGEQVFGGVYRVDEDGDKTDVSENYGITLGD